MASVYLAQQESLKRNVALKILKQVESESHTRRFLSEGRIIASLDHPNIITIHDIGVHDGCHYISMAYHPGGDLESRMANGVSTEEAVCLVRTLADSLNYVHERNIIHRDVKPANVLFRGDSPILTDFGVAKEQELELGLTRDGLAIGSPHYLSPEQAQGQPIDGRADIYSLGVVFYQMLTGKRPFEGDSVMDTLIAHLRDPIPKLPQELAYYQPIIDRMLAKKADQRFCTAGELLQALDTESKHRVSSRSFATAVVGSGGRLHSDLFARLRSWTEDLPTALITSSARRSGKLLGVIAMLVVGAIGSWTWLNDGQSGEIDTAMVAEAEPTANLLDQAREAVLADRLTTPPQDNAYYYYQQILETKPGHAEAQVGIEELTTVYIERAEAEMAALRYRSARKYINDGLRVDPENQQLLAMQSQSHLVKNAPTQVARKVQSFFKDNF